MNDITKEQKIKGAFLGSIVGDALCLGSHYEYDAEKIYRASPTEGTLPVAVYFILKYANQKDALKTALQANTMVGGDNASRAIAIGMVLGAHNGVEAIPKKWKENLDQWNYCEEMLNKLPLLR